MVAAIETIYPTDNRESFSLKDYFRSQKERFVVFFAKKPKDKSKLKNPGQKKRVMTEKERQQAEEQHAKKGREKMPPGTSHHEKNADRRGKIRLK